MLKTIINKTAVLRKNISTLDNQPIGKAALVVIIFLDIFILVSIFEGLSDHTRQLARPDHVVPRHCQQIVLDGEWNETTRLHRLAKLTSLSKGSRFYRDKRERERFRHPICKSISDLFYLIEDDKSLSGNLEEIVRMRRESRSLKSELERVKGAYDTALLEKMAGDRQASIESVKKEIQRKTVKTETLLEKQQTLESSVLQDNRVKELFRLIDGITTEDRESLREELRMLNFWYPVKRLGMEMLFLLPLFLVFYFWNTRSMTGHRPFQLLVSSHLLIVVFIPVLFKVAELIYDIVPKKLLKHIIELLESLNLVAIWHYLMMAMIIVAALVLIYFFQKKLFSREKLLQKRIANGLCQQCGAHLPSSARACPFCGFDQFRQCSQCGKPTHVHGRFCRECGHELVTADRKES